MLLTTKVFWTPKLGNSSEEYEDAYCQLNGVEEAEIFRCAIADGATQTSFSRFWAQLLVNEYCEEGVKEENLQKSLKPLQDKWRTEADSKPLPWYAQEKIRQGAFATILGLSLREENQPDGIIGSWTAFAIGDSCLFHIRENKILKSFPLQHSDDFNSSPALLSSNSISNENIEYFSHAITGTWYSGDVFFLMTDAMACWFLQCKEQGIDAVSYLAHIETHEEFMELVESERDVVDALGRKLLKNDDVTLFRVFVF